MHQQPRATEQPLAPKIASTSGHRSGVAGSTVTFMIAAARLFLQGSAERPSVRLPAIVTANRIAVRKPRIPDDRRRFEGRWVSDGNLDVESCLIAGQLVALLDSDVLAERCTDLVEVGP